MWEHGVSKTYKGITKEKIWEIWTDVNNWAKWHDDLDYCKIEGKFEVGNHFKLKPTGAPAVKIHLIEINEGNSFTDCTNFFGAKMYDTHSMKETKDGLEISNKVMVTGPLRWLWIKLVAQNVANTSEAHLDAIAKLAKESK
ncbi:MAG UNVERIFIED_CONTAM: hypothetical protein LVQ98_04585 [Rickettsiaceae bacterium]|jgi:hypothetical protein